MIFWIKIESQARILILLDDMPIKWFLRYLDNRWKQLSDFGRDRNSYGRLHSIRVGNKEIEVLPLAHPRQIAKLGKSSAVWYNLHKTWLELSAKIVAHDINVG